jgi:hypothetical protein
VPQLGHGIVPNSATVVTVDMITPNASNSWPLASYVNRPATDLPAADAKHPEEGMRCAGLPASKVLVKLSVSYVGSSRRQAFAS